LRIAVQRLSDQSLAHALSNPEMPQAQAQAALAELLGETMTPQIRNLVNILLGRQQNAVLPRILERFEELVNRDRHIVRASVRSAVALSPEELTSLQAAIVRRSSALGVVLDQQVEPAIGGGLIVRIGDVLLDGSVDARLAALRRSLLAQ
jgi:F-type H+-transporting ATPase subunit delta